MDTTKNVADGSRLPPQRRKASRHDLEELAQRLIDRARKEGLELVGPDGLLAGVTKLVVETALEAELTARLGYEPQRAGGAQGALSFGA